jgi:Zn-dependent protease with chaperone function
MPAATMDFFEHQEKARKKTKRLIAYFVLAVALMIAVIYVLIAGIFLHSKAGKAAGPGWIWDPGLFLGIAAGTIAVITVGSLVKIGELSAGGSALAMRMGGRQINPNTRDPDERKLMNVIEEMSIASGISVPPVFVLESEKGINAFAAGFKSGDAAVCVTRGCMKLLTRDELQGVIAHEFSHILNGDMRLNMRLMGIVFGILCLTIIGRILLSTRGRKNPLPLVGLVLVLLGWVGFFFGRLIKSAVSRQREFLADAAAVQFTRNPDGLAGALKKIGRVAWGSRVGAASAEEASHFFFGNAVGQSWLNFLETHPPLEERIRRIDPSFDGKFPRVAVESEERPMARDLPPRVAGLPTIAARSGSGGTVGTPVSAAAVLSTLGSPTPHHLDRAAGLLAALPDVVVQAAHEPFDANALVYALLLSVDVSARNDQLRELERQTIPGLFLATSRFLPLIAELDRPTRLALVEMVLPALRGLTGEQYERFACDVKSLIEADQGIDLFEYALQKMLMRHLEPQFKPTRKAVTQYYVLKPVVADCAVLLSALARFGQDDPKEIEKAFHAGVEAIGQQQHHFELLGREKCNLPEIDQALDRLVELASPLKKCVLIACAHAVASDGVLKSREAELLRAIADTLDCPIPPILAQGALR